MSAAAILQMTSPIGALTLNVSDGHLVSVHFGHLTTSREQQRSETTVGEADARILENARCQLEEYFVGARTEFDLPLAATGTQFQQAAWRVLTTIPYGETFSYAQQAAAMGRPTATRAVGAANGRNPLPIVVPCHRVIGSNGTLTGFAGGVPAKQWLLNHERAVLARSVVAR